MGLRVANEIGQRSSLQPHTFIFYHEFGNTQCCIGCHLDRPEVPRWKP